MTTSNTIPTEGQDAGSVQTTAATVPTARTNVTAPLISTVAAGAGNVNAESIESTAIPSILDLLGQVQAAGIAKGALDPRNTSDNMETSCNLDVTECEAELINFLRAGKEGHCFEDPDYFEHALSVSGGATPFSIVQEYYGWREARRVFSDQLRGYLLHVDKDEARRQKQEEGISLLPAVDYTAADNEKARKTGWKKFMGQLTAITTAMETERGIWESDRFMDRFVDLPGLKNFGNNSDTAEPYSPQQSDEFWRTIGALLFEDRLAEGIEVDPVSRALEVRSALQLAATYLNAPMNRAPENKLLIAAAVTVQRMRDKKAKKAKRSQSTPVAEAIS